MINVTVWNIKDVIKYLVGIILAVVTVVSLTRYFSGKKGEKPESFSFKEWLGEVAEENAFVCLEEEIPLISQVYSKNKQIANDEVVLEERKSPLLKLLDVQLAMMESTKIAEPVQTNKEEPKQENNTPLTEAQVGVPTEVVQENNTANNKYNDTYGEVKIKNESDKEITQEMLKPDIQIEKRKVLVFHTHTCESYTSSPNYTYEATGTFRTTDLNYSVARVGDELTNYLKNARI